MVQSKVWKSGLLKPIQPHLRATSAEDLACELVKLLVRKHKMGQRLKLLRNLSGAVLTETDFNRLEKEASDDIAEALRMIKALKQEMKRRGIKL